MNKNKRDQAKVKQKWQNLYKFVNEKLPQIFTDEPISELDSFNILKPIFETAPQQIATTIAAACVLNDSNKLTAAIANMSTGKKIMDKIKESANTKRHLEIELTESLEALEKINEKKKLNSKLATFTKQKLTISPQDAEQTKKCNEQLEELQKRLTNLTETHNQITQNVQRLQAEKAELESVRSSLEYQADLNMPPSQSLFNEWTDTIRSQDIATYMEQRCFQEDLLLANYDLFKLATAYYACQMSRKIKIGIRLIEQGVDFYNRLEELIKKSSFTDWQKSELFVQFATYLGETEYKKIWAALALELNPKNQKAALISNLSEYDEYFQTSITAVNTGINDMKLVSAACTARDQAIMDAYSTLISSYLQDQNDGSEPVVLQEQVQITDQEPEQSAALLDSQEPSSLQLAVYHADAEEEKQEEPAYREEEEEKKQEEPDARIIEVEERDYVESFPYGDPRKIHAIFQKLKQQAFSAVNKGWKFIKEASDISVKFEDASLVKHNISAVIDKDLLQTLDVNLQGQFVNAIKKGFAISQFGKNGIKCFKNSSTKQKVFELKIDGNDRLLASKIYDNGENKLIYFDKLITHKSHYISAQIEQCEAQMIMQLSGDIAEIDELVFA